MSTRILFVIASVILLGAALFNIASHGRTSRSMANGIVADDLAGHDTTAARASLKDYAAAHMGATVDYTLKGSYDRAQAAAQAAATAASPSTQVYAAAQAACSGKTDSITQARCNQAYLAAHPVTTAPPVAIPAPKLADYQYAAAAPLWSPDLGGALLLGAGAAFVMGAVIIRPKRRR